MIFDDEKVYHFSMNETVPQARGVFLQLPKSNGHLGYNGRYFGYSDAKGILYFINSDIKKSITQFHKKLNIKGHKIIQGSKYKLKKVCEGLGSCDFNDQDKEQPFEYSNVKSFCTFSLAVWKLI